MNCRGNFDVKSRMLRFSVAGVKKNTKTQKTLIVSDILVIITELPNLRNIWSQNTIYRWTKVDIFQVSGREFKFFKITTYQQVGAAGKAQYTLRGKPLMFWKLRFSSKKILVNEQEFTKCHFCFRKQPIHLKNTNEIFLTQWEWIWKVDRILVS